MHRNNLLWLILKKNIGNYLDKSLDVISPFTKYCPYIILESENNLIIHKETVDKHENLM